MERNFIFETKIAGHANYLIVVQSLDAWNVIVTVVILVALSVNCFVQIALADNT